MVIKDPEKEKSSIKEQTNVYLYYTGLGFQMIATIGLFAFIGYKLDISKGKDPGIYTAIFSLVGVFISLIGTIRSVMKRR